jgi:hypothetical protein
MATIRANYIDGEPVEFVMDEMDTDDPGRSRTIPLVVGWDPATGTMITARELGQRRRILPEECDHAGASWSPNLVVLCPHCRAHMDIPPRFLARRPASDLTTMHELWRAAGWPEWVSDNGRSGWNAPAEYWQIMDHPLFAGMGGIAVRHDRVFQFTALVREFEDGMDGMDGMDEHRRAQI